MTTLNFTLSPQATQKVHEALLCLSKFSEFVSLDARRNKLCLSALNSTKSAYGAVHLGANRFCEEFNFVPAEGEERFQSRLQVKALLSVFRQRYLDSKDKSTSISRCEVRLSTTAHECRLLVRLLCNHGVLKTYKLTYEDVDIMHAIFDKSAAAQHWRISSSLLKEYMEHFGAKAEQLEVSSAAASGRASFTSFTEKLIDGKEILKQPLQTTVALDTGDFDEFHVDDGVRVSVSLKDFKAITGHASTLEVPVEAWYSRPGKPMQVTYARDGMDVEFTLMTAADIKASQNTGMMGRIVTVQRRMEERPSSVAPQGSRESTGVRQQERQESLGSGERSRLSSIVQQQSQSLRPTPVIKNNHDEDEDDTSFNRQPTQPTPRPPTMPPTPPPPPQTAEMPLFLNYSEDEDDAADFEDLVQSLDNERGTFMLGWDTSGTTDRSVTTTSNSSRARSRRTVEDDEDDDEDDEEIGVGPTQQSVPPPRGLFD